MEIIRKAEEQGLVLQPSNSREIVNICCCCGDCCQVLRHLKRLPAPAELASTPFVAHLDPDVCIGCETCVERCQMDALSMQDETAVLNPRRCIGCGLCVSTCPSEALTLIRKPEEQQPQVPRNQMEVYALRARMREQARSDLESKLRRHQEL